MSEHLRRRLIGKKARIVVETIHKTVILEGKIIEYAKPFILIETNGKTRAINENYTKEIIIIDS